MAKTEREPIHEQPSLDLSDEEVQGRWEEILPLLNPKTPRAATAIWTTIGENYKSLGHRRAM
ncbi:MAG: hypothetical protein M3144_12580 [Actinomycetota bacterium]|nr:hypothetical protein [Actinomycetota bacterium]